MKLILLFASQPLIAEVLPSLCPPLHPVQAAFLYHAMLRDQLAEAAEIKDAKIRICFAPGMLPGCFEGDYQWQRQEGESQAERLAYAVESAFQGGAESVVALGLRPALAPAEALWLAFEALKSHSVAGGRALLGLSRPLPALCACDSDHLARTARAYGLGFQSVDMGLLYESLPALRQSLKDNPQLAPLSAAALASMA